MTRTNRLLSLALAGSLLLHFLPFLPGLISAPEKPSTAQAMSAQLRPPPPPMAAPPDVPLILPEQPKVKAPEKAAKTEKKPRDNSAATPKTWTQAVRQHLKKLNEEGRFYPEEARRNGIEGDVEILIIFDEHGKVMAARVEQSSGHRILDEGALRAIRSITSTASDAPRETVLPVSFRLR